MENFSENFENEEESLIPISGMYKDWFIDYASYVILERAIPETLLCKGKPDKMCKSLL